MPARAYDHSSRQDGGASVQNFSDAPGKPIAPHFIDLRGLYPADAYCHLTGMQALNQGSIYRCEGRPLFFNS